MTTPGPEVTGGKLPPPPAPTVPVETLIDSMKPEQPLVIESGGGFGASGTSAAGAASSAPSVPTPQ